MNGDDPLRPRNPPIRRRPDGKYDQQLGGRWVAEYSEEPQRGLWRVDVFHRDVNEWLSVGHSSLEGAARAAREYFDRQ